MGLGAAGATVGASIGVATAGIGLEATVPLGICGVAVGFLGAKTFRRCPNCTKVFRL